MFTSQFSKSDPYWGVIWSRYIPGEINDHWYCLCCRNRNIFVTMGAKKSKPITTGELSQTNTANDQIKSIVAKVTTPKNTVKP